jgi:hypothetical protein
MAFEHKDNSGSLFRNGYKTQPLHPDHQGECKIVCPHCNQPQVWKISAWVNDLKNSPGKYFGLAFGIHQAKETPIRTEQDFDDDIPF